jgi:hypothetical protein
MNPVVAVLVAVAAILLVAAPEIYGFWSRRIAKTPAKIDRSRWVNDLFSLAAQASATGENSIAESAKALIAALVNVEAKK